MCCYGLTRGVREFVETAADAVSEADELLAELQDSMMPVEVGDAELRAGLAEVRERLGPLPDRAQALLRGFGRLDVFPPGDSGAQRGLNALLRLRTPQALSRVVERFGDYRGYLYFCGLGSSLLAKGLIRPADAA